ncbi:hypothetical protein [Pseudonocardia broussonetiae]|uniref:Uncharacterized protein n=1 Tax=Pseudonocardia broussonetiae TaxID=2736640 RepID=A0A6M6JQL8_9PSEU|nr:hypothetical protein [Pseudonocardia broussonetiae]QJY49570.1 hypothetical protein HOP40_30580 [Pseudonocardia broussonetiae]
MIVDCDSCEVRGNACGDCVIGVLLGVPGVPARRPDDVAAAEEGPSGASTVQLDAPEQRALAVLADQGLVPRLRLVAAPRRRMSGGHDDGGAARDTG